MHERKEEKVSLFRVLAMDSSSTVAPASVSRSESLLRQVMTRCRRLGGVVAVSCGGPLREWRREDIVVFS